jgi:hypothetical protein
VLQQAASDGKLIFYDRYSVPRTWQSDGIEGATPLLYSAKYRTNSYMYQESGYYSDGGTEFPWLIAAGLDGSTNGSTDRFIIPGTKRFIRLMTRTRGNSPEHFGLADNVRGPNLGWTFARGTVFGEVLRVSGIPFEIRLRAKAATGWVMDVLRPFESPADLVAAIHRICDGKDAPNGCTEVNRPAFLIKLENPTTRTAARNEFINASLFQTRREPLELNSVALDSTLKEAMVHELPDFPDDVRRALLTQTPFKSVFGKPWVKGNFPSWAPICRTQSCIVPQNYFAAFIPMTQEACMKCHDSAGRHVDNFDPLKTQMFAPSPRHFQFKRPRTWYGHVSGDDGILSFHPFEREAVYRGAPANRAAIDRCLASSGMLDESPQPNEINIAPVLSGVR